VEIEVNGTRRAITLRQDGQAWIAEIDGRELAVDLVRAGERWSLLVRAPGPEPDPRTGSDPGVGLKTRPYESGSADAGSANAGSANAGSANAGSAGSAGVDSVGAGLQTRPRPHPVHAFRSYELAIEERSPGELVVFVEGRAIALSVPQLQRRGQSPQRRRAASGGAAARVVAPMPGRVVKVLAKVGQAVEDRQPLVVVEAMKMENELRSPRSGIVSAIEVAEGMAVESGAVLVVVE
jgi:biotin carboxyl carrier protein